MGFVLSGYYATWQASLLDRGFTLNNISMLIAVSMAVSVVFDVPSAMLSDRFGHKRTVMLGLGIFVAGFFIPSVWHHPLSLVATVIVVTVGEIFIEGAIDAWSADMQKSARGGVTNHAFMSFDQMQRLGMVVGAVTVPTLATKVTGVREGWIVYALISVGILLYGLKIPSGAKPAARANDSGAVAPAHAPRGASALLELKGHLRSETLLMLVLGAFLYGLGDGANQTAFWPRLKEIGVSDPMWLGFVQAGMSLSRVLGLQMWKRSKRVESAKLPGLSVIGSSLLFMAFGAISNPVLALAVWMGRILILSAYFSALRGLTQKIYSDSRWRATIASALGSAMQIGVIALTSVLGLMKGTDISRVCYLGAVLTFASGVVFWNVKPENRGDDA